MIETEPCVVPRLFQVVEHAPRQVHRDRLGLDSLSEEGESGQRLSVNVLTPEEPTDWGGGSGLYDAFVEVRPT